MLVPVYDIKNCGPRHRYAANGKLIHNCEAINMQNLPSRGSGAGKLKSAIEAPPGYVIINADSSQIEARTVAWLAGQTDLVEAFAKGEDVYKTMASAIYNKSEEEITKQERFVGKTCVAEGTLVLCQSGWKRIETVTTNDRIWDGEEWVCHSGVVSNGTKKVLQICGLWLTPDHQVWSGEWKRADYIQQDENILCQALGTAGANLPSQATWLAPEGFVPSLLSAIAAHVNIPLTKTISNVLGPLAALFVLKKRGLQNDIGYMLKHFLTMNTEGGCSIALHQQSQGATLAQVSNINITGSAVFSYMKLGEKTVQNSCDMPEHFQDGITQSTKWIGLMSTARMLRAIFGLYQEQLIYKTKEKLQTSKPVYDILNSGLRNRFVVLTNRGPLIVHNCILGAGYGMGAGKFQTQLKTFGVDVEEAEAKHIIAVYRQTYPQISSLWRQAQRCIEAILTGADVQFGVVDAVYFDPRERGFKLPSGLWQRYEGLRKVTDAEGKDQFEYKTRKGTVKIYGGKVVENLCQATARCIMAEQMVRIAKRYRPVLTVHDSLVCMAPEGEVHEAAAYLDECMRWCPDWAAGLPLACEVGFGPTYGDC